MKKWIIKILSIVGGTGLILFLDQWTKVLATTHLKGQEDVILIRNALQFHYLENHGMAFGLLQGKQIFFYVATAIVLGIIVFLLIRMPMKKRFIGLTVTLVMIMGGAIGNLIDRVAHQYVIDFIYVSLIDFPVFNTADCFVTVGCLLLVVLLLFVYKDDDLKAIFPAKKRKKTETETKEGGKEEA